MRLLKPVLAGLCAISLLAAATPYSARAEFTRPSRIAFPETGSYSPQKAALGKMLFFDARLSRGQNLSCASCHNPSFGWESPVPRAIGGLNRPLKRHTPTLENLAEATAFFWDGRAATLEEQARSPITHPDEMDSSLPDVVRRLSAISGYRRNFAIAFPEEGLTETSVLAALATYQRTLRSGWSPFDDWIEGDEDAISSAARRGFEVFTGVARCNECHSGWSFTDHDFHRVGVGGEDIGRGLIDPALAYGFKTPGLRNIALRAPYMHNGSLGTLRDVVAHYRQGGTTVAGHPSELTPLQISDRQASDLVAFLETLTAYEPHVSTPALPVD